MQINFGKKEFYSFHLPKYLVRLEEHESIAKFAKDLKGENIE